MPEPRERGDIRDAMRITGLKQRDIEQKAAEGKIPGAAKLFGSRNWSFDLARLRGYVVKDIEGFKIRLAGQKVRQALYRAAESDCRDRYERGTKRALWDMLAYCAAYRWALPLWAADAISDADLRYETGKLRSWDKVFGRPFPGKTRKGSSTRAQGPRVYEEVNRLHRDGHPIDEALFEKVAKILGIGSPGTIRRLYYEHSHSIRRK
jgi:hypothetical protein